MTLKEQFEKETELNLISEYSEFKDEWSGDYSNDYVEWLESKINYTRCFTKLPIKKEIDFDGNLLAEIETTDKNLKVLRCIDGGGNTINVAKVQIDEVVR